MIFFFTLYTPLKSVWKTKGGEKHKPTIRTPIWNKIIQYLMQKLLEQVFALSHGQMFSSRRKLELDDKLQGLNVTP